MTGKDPLPGEPHWQRIMDGLLRTTGAYATLEDEHARLAAEEADGRKGTDDDGKARGDPLQ